MGDPVVGTVGAARLAWALRVGGCSLPLCELLLAGLPTWMDIEGLQHGATNILFINVSGFSRQTMHYFMVRKNQRKFK